MRAGVVGSRRRSKEKDHQKVIDLINSLPPETLVVSGGCKGIDTWAVKAAEKRKLQVLVFKPGVKEGDGYVETVKKYYDRNKKIAINSDTIYAFVASDRKGGTENTIQHAKKLGRKIVIK